MLRLTDEIGQEVLGADGHVLGRVRDLSVGVSNPVPLVQRMLVRGRRRQTTLVPWDAIESFEHTSVQLAAGAVTEPVERDRLGLANDELLLVRDVLDTQIVDIAGQRLVRVGDVLLARREDERLTMVAVEVGAGAVVRRLGLHHLGDRLAERAVRWSDLHLTSARGHRVQLDTPISRVHQLGPAELAALVGLVAPHHAAQVLKDLPPERVSDALLVLPPAEADALLAHVEQVAPEHASRLRHLLHRRRPRSSP